MGTDLQGRPWLTVAEAKPGVTIECDDDFTCLKAGTRSVIQEAEDGTFYIECSAGEHYLDGQLSNDGTYYVGLYLVKDSTQ